MPTTQEGRLLKLTTPLGADVLLIKRLRADEGLNRLFHFELNILHDHESEMSDDPMIVDVSRLLGQSMTVTVEQTDDAKRYFNGICARFHQGNRKGRYTVYEAIVVPKVWLLTQKIQSRIFQHISVPDILKKIFNGFEVDYEIEGTFHQRNYCVQYHESDFDFASRLMEEEGIYYYFAHNDGSHRMVIANSPIRHRVCPSRSKLPFKLDVGSEESWVATVYSWNIINQMRSGKYTVWDHNFELPTSHLEAEQPTLFSYGGNQSLEVYDFPGGYAHRFDGIDKGGGEQPSELEKVFQDNRRVVGIRQQEIDVSCKTINASTDSCALIGGYRFELENHPVAENNGFHVIVSQQIEAVQSPMYQSDETVGNPYAANFSCIPLKNPFRPLRRTRKPFVQGTQTALVVGPAGEEIFTDKYGRVKVQFYWDREGKKDADSSCWVRVGTLWAGKQWGVIHIPRIGQEVIVDFIEGDPDRPIIIGSVYNPNTMPPYELPANKTQSGVKSRSSKDGSPANFNEFRFEDKKGKEEVYLHAEKDWTIMVENDKNQTVGHDETLTVKNDRTKIVRRDEKNTIGRDYVHDVVGESTNSVGKNKKTSVADNENHSVGKKYTLTATNEINASSMKVEISAGTELILNGPGGQIKIDASGVTITGVLVKIN